MRVQRIAENYFLSLFLSMGLLFLPLLNWLGLAWAILMVLRKNTYEGAVTIAIIGFLCVYVMSGLEFHNTAAEWITAVSFILPMWLMAYSLRVLRSLSISLQLGFASVMVLVLVNQWVVGPITYDEASGYLSARLFSNSSGGGGLTEAVQQAYVEVMASTMMMAWPAVLFLIQASLLLFARYIQSRWYNPGGFQAEFHGLRLSRLMTPVVLLTLVWAGFAQSQVAIQAAGLSLMVCSFAGVAWLHWYVKFRQLSGRWLAVLYLILFVLSAWVLPALVVIAILDSHLDLRQRVRGRK